MDGTLKRLQAYLANPTDPEGEAITALATQEEKRLIKDILSRLNHLKADGTDAALLYNQYGEALRAYKTKEITEEEYKNNPLKKAYEDYAQAIPYRVKDLGSYCIIRAIVNTPDYKRAVDNAIKRAEKLLKHVQKTTDINARETAFIAGDLIPEICELGYILYHAQEWEQYTAFKKKTEAEAKRIVDNLQGPPTEADDKQINELYEGQARKAAELSVSIYKANKARIITEQILNRIFPEQKPAIRRAVETWQAPEGYYLLAQNRASNKLSKKLTERIAAGSAQLDIYGNGEITEKDFRLFVKGYTELINGVNETAARLLDSLMISATRNGLQNTLTTLPIKEYLDMRGLKDEKEIREQVKGDIDALERISFEYKGTGKNQGAWLKVSISGGTVGQIKNGDIIFRFNQDFFDSFKEGEGNRFLYMYFPREALTGSVKLNPWKYWLGRKIAEHKRMNIGKPNEDTISVQTLIDACPNYPTYEKVMQGDRAISRRIIEPFERDLDALSPSLSWEYQGLSENPRNYQEFISANIVIHWSAYPDTAELEAGKKQRAKKQRASNGKPRKKGGVKHSKRGGETQQKGG